MCYLVRNFDTWALLLIGKNGSFNSANTNVNTLANSIAFAPQATPNTSYKQ
jgi:hypothetical protein